MTTKTSNRLLWTAQGGAAFPAVVGIITAWIAYARSPRSVIQYATIR